MPKPDSTPIVQSVEELNKLLSEKYHLHGPEDTARSLEPFFLQASPIHSRLRRLKQLYGAHPSTEERFEANRIRSTVPTDPLANLRSYQRAFAQMAESEEKLRFAQGSVKRFLDLGCSPGGFSNWLLESNEETRGVGITLSDEEARWAMVVEGTHLKEPRYELCFADIVSLAKDAIAKGENPVIGDAEQSSRAFDLIIAGAFPTLAGRVPASYRIQLALSQLLILLCNIQRGGDAIIVTNTKTRSWIIEIIALLRRCFSKITTGKGSKLHSERSSCYLICADFCATDDQIAEYVPMLKNALAQVGHLEDEQPEEEQDDLEEVEEDRKWRRLLQFSEQTTEELFAAEHRFVLDLFEPVWQKQYDAIYTSFTKALNRSNDEHPAPLATSVRQKHSSRPPPVRVHMSGQSPDASTYGGDGEVPKWRRSAAATPSSGSEYFPSPSPSDAPSPRETTGSASANASAAKYAGQHRRASSSVADASSNWRDRTKQTSSTPVFRRPRGSSISDANPLGFSKPEKARDD